MNSPIRVTNIRVTNRMQSASLSIAGLLLAIASLWLMLAATNMSLNAQTSSTPSPADWTEFHRDNMQRWNPYETTLGVNNVGTLGLKWSYVITNPDQFSDSSPAVTNGVVYIGAEDGNVYALNASTGQAVEL
jgi:outer membrane protein assembly factor BamB